MAVHQFGVKKHEQGEHGNLASVRDKVNESREPGRPVERARGPKDDPVETNIVRERISRKVSDLKTKERICKERSRAVANGGG